MGLAVESLIWNKMTPEKLLSHHLIPGFISMLFKQWLLAFSEISKMILKFIILTRPENKGRHLGGLKFFSDYIT